MAQNKGVKRQEGKLLNCAQETAHGVSVWWCGGVLVCVGRVQHAREGASFSFVAGKKTHACQRDKRLPPAPAFSSPRRKLEINLPAFTESTAYTAAAAAVVYTKWLLLLLLLL